MEFTARNANWQHTLSESDRQRAKTAFIDILQHIFLFFCFFPYIALAPLPTDIQPYALLFSLAVCAFASFPKMPRSFWLLAVAPLSALVLWLGDDQSFFGFRETLSFLSPMPIALATVIILNQRSTARPLQRFVAFATYAWLFFGLLERLTDPNLLIALIPNTRGGETRGVAGLATEPSFYGVECLFLLILNYLCNNNNKRIMYALLFQIIVLAQSTITIVLLLIFMLYRTIFFPTWRQLVVIGFLAIIGLGLFVYILPQLSDLRVATLATNLVTQPMILFQADTSLNARAGHVIFSVAGFLDNRGLPHGFDHFTDYILQRADSLGFTWLGGLAPHLKIMSGYGAIMFELGVFGLLTPITVVMLIFRYFRADIRLFILWALYISTIMFSAIQISLPLFGVMLGWLAKMLYDHGSEREIEQFARGRSTEEGPPANSYS